MTRRRRTAQPASPGPRSGPLITAAAATLALYGLPYWIPAIRWLAWPLILLSTLVHELGHGLTALLLGGDFLTLQLWPDASGMAFYSAEFGPLRQAVVAAGGLLGPPLASWSLFWAGRRPLVAQRSLRIGAAVLLVVLLLWVRNPFAIFFIAFVGVGLAAISIRGTPVWSQFTCLFLAVQLALAAFARGDYLFARDAVTAGGVGPSDTRQIAEALALPHWFWGLLIALLSAWLIWHGLRIHAFRNSLR